MKNEKGFTLIEALAVIIILGIIMIIAIPSVAKYISRSDKAVYASDISAYVETIRGKYEMKEYGAFLKSDEIMVIPIKHIILEKGDNQNTPYGEYDFNRSYVLVVPERNGYIYYATVIDSEKYGIINVPTNKIGEDAIEEEITEEIPLLSSYNNPGSTYVYNNITYRRSDVRDIIGEDVNLGEKVYVFKKIGV